MASYTSLSKKSRFIFNYFNMLHMTDIYTYLIMCTMTTNCTVKIS